MKSIDHLGLSVRSLDDALLLFVDLLGLELSHRGEVETPPVRYAFVKVPSGALLELAEYGDERLGDQLGVVDHFAFEVADIEATVADLKVLGIEVDRSKPQSQERPDGTVLTVSTMPEQTLGIRIQLVERGIDE